MFSLKNKKAIITGAGSGIGKAIATLFASQGAEVHVIELSEESSKKVLDEIHNTNGKAYAHICNVSDQKEVIKVFEEIGAHDILINNAGIAHIGKADTTSEEDFDRVISVNVKGVYNCIYASIPWLKKNGGGVIINMAS